MRKRLAILIAALAAACLPTNPPRPPSPPSVPQRTIAVQLTPALEGARVVLTLDGKTMAATTNARGYHAWEPVPDCPVAHTYAIHVEADGYQPIDSPAIGDCRNHEVGLTLTPTHANAGEHGAVHVRGTAFVLEDGSPWYWYGFSDFALFQRYIRGENIDQILDERIALGANVLRVFGMFVGTPGDASDQGIGATSGLGHFDPRLVENYYGRLAEFADLLGARGLRLEFVCLADEQVLQLDAHAHVRKIFQAIGSKWNVFVEIANEPFKNGVDANDASFLQTPHTVPVATGSYEVPWDAPAPFLVADYITWHPDRGDEWPRFPRGLGEIRDGASTYGGAHVPVVADETMGGAETEQPGRRSATPDDFRAFAGLCKLFGAGATYHSDDGIASRLLEPVQKASAEAFFAGAMWAPIAAQFAPYQRGGAGGGAGVGNMPLDHHDLDETIEPRALRSFAKQPDAFEWTIAVRPSPGWSAVPLRGCTIVEQPYRGFVKLSCPQPAQTAGGRR